MTKGFFGDVKNLHFTTVLRVRHAQSDERVARTREEFANKYHSFDRSTRTKWRKGCSATWKICILPRFWVPTRMKLRKGGSASSKICILPQFWASDAHELTTGSLGQLKNLHFLPQFWASDTHEVTRGLSNPQVRSLRPDRKNIFFRGFWLAVSLCSLFSSPFSLVFSDLQCFLSFL